MYVIYMNLVTHGAVPLLALLLLNTRVYLQVGGGTCPGDPRVTLQLRTLSRHADTVAVPHQHVQTREVRLARVSCLIVIGQTCTLW